MNREPSASEQLQRKPKIVAAIPCFNEARFIGSVVIKAKKFVDSVKEWKGFDVVSSGTGDDVSFYEHTMDWVTQDGTEVHVEQVAVARWKHGKIVHERFYYSMG